MTHATSSREALAAALAEAERAPQIAADPRAIVESRNWKPEADYLIATGAVVDLAALADDEEAVEAVAQALADQITSWKSLSRDGKDTCRADARAAIRALAEVVNRGA